MNLMLRDLRLPLLTSLFGLVLYNLAPAAPVLSEFIAGGSDAPEAADGSTPDWIEIHNPNAHPLQPKCTPFHSMDIYFHEHISDTPNVHTLQPKHTPFV